MGRTDRNVQIRRGRGQRTAICAAAIPGIYCGRSIRMEAQEDKTPPIQRFLYTNS